MAVDTYTTFLQETEPKDREQSIESYLKARLQSLDKAVAGYTSVSLQSLSGTVDLTPTQAKHRVIKLTGVPSGAVTLRIPNMTGANADPIFVNACTGSNSTVTVKSKGANTLNASGVAIVSLDVLHVRHDGESAYAVGESTPAGGDPGAWTAYLPTVTASSGTITSYTATGRYSRTGKKVFVEIKITISNNGTGAGFVRATLPVTASGSFDYILPGRETLLGGKMLQGHINPATPTQVGIANFDNSYPGATGYVLVLSGVYEAA